MTLRIVTAADDNFVLPLATLLHSLRSSQTSDVEAHVLTGDMTRQRTEAIRSIEPNLYIHRVDTSIFQSVSLPSYLSIPTLFRLTISNFVSSGRIVYLDSDTIVRRPLDDLFELPTGESGIAAVRDPVAPFFSSPAGPPWRELGAEPDDPYFNAGVLLIDLEKASTAQLWPRALASVQKSRLPNGDQCALNAAARGAWEILDPRWNMQAGHLDPGSLAWVYEDRAALETAIADPAVVHFNTSRLGRPWETRCQHPFGDDWRRLAAATGLCDTYAPRPSRPPVRRVRRAISILLKG